MSALSSTDTDPQTAARLAERWRLMSAADKVRIVEELNEHTSALARAGVRRRFPDADRDEVEMRVTALKVGRQLMIDAYGWDPMAKGN